MTEIVFTNPCFIGDIIAGTGPMHVWKKKTGVKITLLYEENRYFSPLEPLSILSKDPYIDEIHTLPWNTIPRAMDKPNNEITPWVESFLGRKPDLHFDLHKHLINSTYGYHIYNFAGLNPQKEFEPLQFFPSKDDIAVGEDYTNHIGVSNRLPNYQYVADLIKKEGRDVVIIGDNLKLTCMEVSCIIGSLSAFVTPSCLHMNLSWNSPRVPLYLCVTENISRIYPPPPAACFNYQLNPAKVFRPYDNMETTMIEVLLKDIREGSI